MKKYEAIVEALDDLKKRGYDADFEPHTNCLYCSELDIRLLEDEFHVDEVYRFEQGSEPGKTTVVYAFSSPTGVKGTVVDEGANYANRFGSGIAKTTDAQTALLKDN